MQEVFTGVSLDDSSDLGRHLLVDEEQSLDLRSMSDRSSYENDKLKRLYSAFRRHGMIIGFLVQLVNVAGSTVMYQQWADERVLSKLSTDPWDTILHAIVFAITQVDLCLYLCMWVALTAILTQSGMSYVRKNYFAPDTASKRSIFVLGVQFYIGVVVGVFFAWALIDFVLGLPVPLLPMLGVFGFGLFISYTMIWCYDLEDYYLEDDCDENDG